MQTSSSAYRTWRESRSASECTATVLRPISLHARMTRRAISPRLAMRTLEIMVVGLSSCPVVDNSTTRQPDNRVRESNSHREKLLAILHRLSVLRKDFHD